MLAGPHSRGIAGICDEAFGNRPFSLRTVQPTAQPLGLKKGYMAREAAMSVLNTGLWTLALIAWSHYANATTIQRCVGSSGQVTFTHTSCPDGSAGQREHVRSPSARSVAPAVRAAVSQAPRSRPTHVGDASTRAGAMNPPATAPRQTLSSKEKVATEKEGNKKKKKKVKYTPWRPARG